MSSAKNQIILISNKYFSNTSLLNLFMAIVYCKPGIVALHQLTNFLAIASKHCCKRLCRGKSSDILNFSRLKIRRFSSDTCPMQVYASLLEVMFQLTEQNKSVPEFSEHIPILAEITIGLMTFLRNCFKQSVNWLFRRSDCGSETGSICYCYCYIVSATIVLLHLCIKFWVEDQKCIGKLTQGYFDSQKGIDILITAHSLNFRFKNDRSDLQNGCLISS